MEEEEESEEERRDEMGRSTCEGMRGLSFTIDGVNLAWPKHRYPSKTLWNSGGRRTVKEKQRMTLDFNLQDWRDVELYVGPIYISRWRTILRNNI